MKGKQNTDSEKTASEKIFETFPFFMHTIMHDFPFQELQSELNKTQARAIHIISFYEKTTMGKVCSRMNMEKGSFTTVVDGLIEKGFVQRERDKNDRRKVNVTLTEKGKEQVVLFERKIEEHIRDKLSVLTTEEKQIFYRAVDDLARLVQKL